MEQNDPYLLRVLMFPWLAHSHISSYLELSKRLARRNFYVYLCSTPVNISSIKDQIEPQIELIQLQLPNLPNLPPHYHTTRNLPTHLNSTLLEAFDLAKPAFSNLLRTLNPDCVIYDTFQPWAPEVASHQNIPAILFLSIGAACVSYSYHLANPPEDNRKFPFPTIQLCDFDDERLRQLIGKKTEGARNYDRSQLCLDRSSTMVAMKTFEDIEGKFMNCLSVLIGKEIVPVGPLVCEVHNQSYENQNQEPCKITEWLGKKQRDSVVYVSFGSEYFMSKEEIEEMARGLELSGQNFIWVLRFTKNETDGKEPDKEVLPSGFLERVGDAGMVVFGWAEQVRILSHPSTGGFLTHCGWGSLMEGLRSGLPLIAFPLQYDQPVNARLVVAELGVAVEIERENGCFNGEKVAKAIRMAMVEKGGDEVRKAAKKMGERLSCRGEVDVDVFVEKLIAICKKKQNL